MKIVSSRLGHVNVAFTLDIYSHAIPEMDEEAAEVFADYPSGAPTSHDARVKHGLLR